MKLPTFAKKDEVPAAFADLYEERDGKFQPKPDDDADDLATTLADEKAKREAAERNATKTANELKKLERKLAAKEHDISDEVIEKVRADIRKELDEEYAPKLADAERLAAENRSMKLDSNVKALAAKASFLPEKLNDFWKLHGDEFDLSSDGKPIIKGKPGADVEKHVAALAKARPEWVMGTNAAGGGGIGGAGGGAATGITFEQLMKDPTSAAQSAIAKR